MLQFRPDKAMALAPYPANYCQLHRKQAQQFHPLLQ